MIEAKQITTKWLRFPGGKKKALTFSYDDGVVADKRLVEVFRKNGLKGTFNINSGSIGKSPSKLTEEEVISTYTPDVCEVACHGLMHATATYCDTAALCVDVVEDRKNLESLLGKRVNGMAYANGSYPDYFVDICRSCGIYYSRTTVATHQFGIPTDWLRLDPTCHHNDPELNNLADRFLNADVPRAPYMFYVWGHSYEFDRDDNWDLMEQFAEKMSGNDDIWYATNMELYLVWRDYKRLECSADGHLIYNPSPRSVWFEISGKIYEVRPFEEIRI